MAKPAAQSREKDAANTRKIIPTKACANRIRIALEIHHANYARGGGVAYGNANVYVSSPLVAEEGLEPPTRGL
jgi:hypothetical protein